MFKRLMFFLVALAVCAAGAGMMVATAMAATPVARWQISVASLPQEFSSTDTRASCVLTGCDKFRVRLANVGGAPMDGSTVSVTDTVASPLQVASAETENTSERGFWSCTVGAPDSVTCTSSGVVGALAQDPSLVVHVTGVAGVPANTVVSNAVTVSGGGAPAASASDDVLVEPTAALLPGIRDFSTGFLDVAGELDTQAAAHPTVLTAIFDLNSRWNPEEEGLGTIPLENVRDIVVDLPPGFVGNPQATPHCPLNLLATGFESPSACPPDTQVGEITLTTGPGLFDAYRTPIYNIAPEPGYPAEFGFTVKGQRVIMYANVRTGSDYGVRVTIPGIPLIIQLEGADVTFFGNPSVQDGAPPPGVALFTNPSDCDSGPVVTTAYFDTWENPAPVAINADGEPDLAAADYEDPQWKKATWTGSPPVTGCEKLQFTPSLGLQVETKKVDEPTGLAVDVHLPENEESNGLPLRR